MKKDGGKKSSKKGLSEVITTLIIIGVSLLGITMIWVVVRNVIISGSEEIDIGKFVVDLDIQKVQVNPSGIDVTVKRNVGQGSLKEISFVISDGTNTQIFKQLATLEELGRQTFTINYTGPLTNISIASTSASGAQSSITDTSGFSGYEAAKNMPGLVSWWKMEGNAYDEMGLNNGTLFDLSTLLVEGKFGKAYRFVDYTTDLISVNDVPSLRLENSNMTIIAWINKTAAGALGPMLVKGDYLYNLETGYSFGIQFINSTMVKITFGTNTFNENVGGNLNTKKLTHVAASQQVNSPARTIKTYIDGTFATQKNSANVTPTNSTGYNLIIGNSHETSPAESFTGTIDEVMIFNRTLSASEIQALYNLDLNK